MLPCLQAAFIGDYDCLNISFIYDSNLMLPGRRSDRVGILQGFNYNYVAENWWKAYLKDLIKFLPIWP